MSMKSFFQSLKNVFWFGSPPDDLTKKPSQSAEDHDVFFQAQQVVDCKGDLKDLKPWIKDKFDQPKISLNDPDSMERYIDLSLDVKTQEGEFRLVYYENNELVLRGDREIVLDLERPIGQKLEVEFKRV